MSARFTHYLVEMDNISLSAECIQYQNIIVLVIVF